MFANKVVLIVGGSGGIGAATAECFAKEKASVAIVGRNEDRLSNVAARCKKLGAVIFTIKADITKDNEVRSIIKQTIDKFGKLDVLVNTAGVFRFALIKDSNALAVCDEIMNTNFRPIVHMTNLAAPYLQKTKGNIVNVSGVSSLRPIVPGISALSVSKAALDHFTRLSAKEFSVFGVRVNVINPGPVKTNILEDVETPPNFPDFQKFGDMTLLKRVSDTEEIAELILYLASDKARGITGSSFIADNGMILN